jgi:uracil phosphoribosyltransferase
MDNVTIVTHPLVGHKMAHLRATGTTARHFSTLVEELSMLLAYEAIRDLETEHVQIETPMETTSGQVLRDGGLLLVPILRAGLGMVPGIRRLVPSARVGHIGIERDHATLAPISYYFKMPGDLADLDVLLLDPMLATGGSAVAAVDALKRAGASRIRMLSLVAAPEGVARMAGHHPDVRIFLAALDRDLDENGYIRPGLGDAGDRIFGTV